ncbi:MAG: rubrerythrin family protein [Bacilli bacterium]|nr:rubrerythrin family protein [Bacilli bacterium]
MKFVLKGTKTEQNLLKAFAGESQARNRYTMYASIAKKDGFEQISAIFLETAQNEYEHATLFYKKLEGSNIEINASYPGGVIGNTLDNLFAAANGELEEATILYPEFAKTAREEGFIEIAVLFEKISNIEANHNKRYLKLYNNVLNNKVFEKENEVEWVCRECGYVHTGNSAPEVCPVCAHAQAFYQLNIENY